MSELLPIVAIGWCLLVFTLASQRELRRARREYARREDLLINQLLHATGKPWQPAPADDKPSQPEPEPRTYQVAPEQHQP